MKNNEKSKSMTYEEALQDASLVEFHAIIRRFETGVVPIWCKNHNFDKKLRYGNEVQQRAWWQYYGQRKC